MALFKLFGPGDITTAQSFLTQMVDVVQEDISGSNTRRKYKVFVTGGLGKGVTSSLFQTVCDQDYTLQTSNEIFDMTVGIREASPLVITESTGRDTAGKMLFPSTSMMMREKISVYSQYAQLLHGASGSIFHAPIASTADEDQIDTALFISFKRLFSRDGIKENTFALNMAATGCLTDPTIAGGQASANTNRTVNSGTFYKIWTDVGRSTSTLSRFGGTCGDIVQASNIANTVGNIWYDQGVIVLDMKKVFSGSQHASGTIGANTTEGDGEVVCGSSTIGSNLQAKFIPDFVVSASIDDVIDHIASCRLGSGSATAATFMNMTNINSTLVFCRATPDEFNYSSNPTYVDPDTNRINVIQVGEESRQRAFSYITSVGLYDTNDNLIAVAKMSRPIEKNDEKDMTIRVRLDF